VDNLKKNNRTFSARLGYSNQPNDIFFELRKKGVLMQDIALYLLLGSRGQGCIYTIDDLADELIMDKKQIRVMLKRLKACGVLKIKREKANRYFFPEYLWTALFEKDGSTIEKDCINRRKPEREVMRSVRKSKKVENQPHRKGENPPAAEGMNSPPNNTPINSPHNNTELFNEINSIFDTFNVPRMQKSNDVDEVLSVLSSKNIQNLDKYLDKYISHAQQHAKSNISGYIIKLLSTGALDQEIKPKRETVYWTPDVIPESEICDPEIADAILQGFWAKTAEVKVRSRRE
jgi:hypothetical protein